MDNSKHIIFLLAAQAKKYKLLVDNKRLCKQLY